MTWRVFHSLSGVFLVRSHVADTTSKEPEQRCRARRTEAALRKRCHEWFFEVLFSCFPGPRTAAAVACGYLRSHGLPVLDGTSFAGIPEQMRLFKVALQFGSHFLHTMTELSSFTWQAFALVLLSKGVNVQRIPLRTFQRVRRAAGLGSFKGYCSAAAGVLKIDSKTDVRVPQAPIA